MAKQAEYSLMHAPAGLLDYYRQMVFLRHFEEKSMQAFRTGKAGGYLHLYSGMEALAIGWLGAIRQGYDYVIAAYRDHAYPIILGTDPVEVMGEIMGRAGGLSRGKGGSMHLYDPDRGFFGGWGIVGGHTALGGGLGLACKYRGEDRITLCVLGDGAANAGIFFETLNMAGLWKLPIVFLIENNFYAMGTSLERHAADPALYLRGAPFAMPHERLDSQDLVKVLADARRIVEHVRTVREPYLVEAITYRFAGHGAADHDRQLYRTRKEEEEWEAQNDPIKVLERHIEEQRLASKETLEAIDEEMLKEADRVYAEADAMPHPDPGEVYDHVYTKMKPEAGH